MKLYISEGAIGLLLIFYMPLVLWLLWKLWFALPKNITVRLSASGIALIVGIAIPLWDVVGTSIKMAELCPNAGLVIRRAVVVDGFYTNYGTREMVEEGFKYVESRAPGNRIIVFVRNGMVKKQEFDANQYIIKSRYEYIYDSTHGPFQNRNDIGVQESIVRDRETKEVLGFSRRYTAYPGWVDRATFSQIGQVLWMCHDSESQDIQLRKKVLLPNSINN